MPPNEPQHEATSEAEHGASWFDRLLDIIAPSDRRTMFVMATMIAVVGVLFATYASLQNKAEAAIDSRIEVKSGPRLDDHEKRIAAIEAVQKQTSNDLSDMRGDIRVIRTLIEQHYTPEKP